MNSFNFEAFRANRDDKRRNYRRWEVSADDVLAAYAAEERDFYRVYLYGANLGGANLRSANLYGANLGGANLRSANLYGANLGGANLGGANLRSANLYGADLGGANLGGANLRGANLRGADLRGANLYGANLGGANLYGANLGGADLGGANLRGANLRGADLVGANLGGADLYGANLGGAKNLINTLGLYVAYAPGLSSRNDYLYGGIDADYALVLCAGCFEGTAAELRDMMAEKSEPWRAAHLRRYEAAITFIEACYQADVDDGVWERMKAANVQSESEA